MDTKVSVWLCLNEREKKKYVSVSKERGSDDDYHNPSLCVIINYFIILGNIIRFVLTSDTSFLIIRLNILKVFMSVFPK